MLAKAAVFMPWWGNPPGWEYKFILRAMASQYLQVILVGDAAKFAPEAKLPRIHCTMDEFEERASKVSNVKIHKRDPKFPRGQCLCELRPMLAHMYSEAIVGFEWWGYGDWDVVWGDWDSFLSARHFWDYDIITSNEETINGCFTLFRNRKLINELYLNKIGLLLSRNNSGLDESGMQQIVKEHPGIRCLYPNDIRANSRHPKWNRCILKNDKLYKADIQGNVSGEIMKFHFPNMSQWPLDFFYQHAV